MAPTYDFLMLTLIELKYCHGSYFSLKSLSWKFSLAGISSYALTFNGTRSLASAFPRLSTHLCALPVLRFVDSAIVRVRS